MKAKTFSQILNKIWEGLVEAPNFVDMAMDYSLYLQLVKISEPLNEEIQSNNYNQDRMSFWLFDGNIVFDTYCVNDYGRCISNNDTRVIKANMSPTWEIHRLQERG